MTATPEERREAAKHDPEIQAIMSDPAMQQILSSLSTPGALQEHMKNPEIAAKLMRLMRAGILG